MADKTHIEWTDATWNLINGCTVVSPGCTNCYAMRLAATRHKDQESRKGLARMHNGHPQWTGEITLNKRVALDPYRWKAPRMIFVCAHGDLFHKDVPDGWIDYVFNMALLCPQHTLQVLTKRPERMREYMQMVLDETEEQTAYRFAVAMLHAGLENTPKAKLPLIQWPPPNVWLGVSVEDQQRANERIPDLLATPAAVRWLSCEPLLGPLDLELIDLAYVESRELEPSGLIWLNALAGVHSDKEDVIFGVLDDPDPKIDWVVAGGESGPDARPVHPDWIRSLRDQCTRNEVAFLFKQWGDWFPIETPGDVPPVLKDKMRLVYRDPRLPGMSDQFMSRVGKRNAGRKLDGVLHDGYPA
jgi:protein gp37